MCRNYSACAGGLLAGWFSDMIVNALVSLVAAIQFNSFRKKEGLPFATAFCTGNLRSMTEYLHKFIFKRISRLSASA